MKDYGLNLKPILFFILYILFIPVKDVLSFLFGSVLAVFRENGYPIPMTDLFYYPVIAELQDFFAITLKICVYDPGLSRACRNKTDPFAD